MTGPELREARRRAGWTQTRLAERLDVTQAYVCTLETGRRPIPPALARRLARTLSLSPTTLPIAGGDAMARPVTNEWVAGQLARLGYPGYAHIRRASAALNPLEVLLRALRLDPLDARLAEGLPWLLLRFGVADAPALVERARVLDVQNRLGFIAALALELAEKNEAGRHRAAELGLLLERLEPFRLAREDDLGRSRMSPRMRRWIRGARSKAAAHWNILSDLSVEHLPYGA